MEQDTGVEPAFTAWEAVVLPIYESCASEGIIPEAKGKFNTFLSTGPGNKKSSPEIINQTLYDPGAGGGGDEQGNDQSRNTGSSLHEIPNGIDQHGGHKQQENDASALGFLHKLTSRYFEVVASV